MILLSLGGNSPLEDQKAGELPGFYFHPSRGRGTYDRAQCSAFGRPMQQQFRSYRSSSASGTSFPIGVNKTA
ncbi:MAG: hypothetical protein QOJ05_1360 [Verrucomicrobiota bacterium]